MYLDTCNFMTVYAHAPLKSHCHMVLYTSNALYIVTLCDKVDKY